MPPTPSAIEELLQSRASVYGGSWKNVGRIVATLTNELDNFLMVFPEGWLPWIEILHKLMRLLGSPKHVDSWRDISGYATLIVDLLEGESNELSSK
jgi:hypothetical protein